MAILGIEALVYGVDDLDRCSRFWEDFGLTPVSRTARGKRLRGRVRLASDPDATR